MRVPSPSRRSRPGVAELYGAVLLVAVTLSLGYAAYENVRLPASREPVFVYGSYTVYGYPSLMFVTVNWSAPATPEFMSIDKASTSGGILAFDGSGYRAVNQLCAPALTTFFSITTGSGTLTVSSDGKVWIDGVQESSASVTPGMHELLISGATGCSIRLPDGSTVSYPSTSVSALPISFDGGGSLRTVIPYVSVGHDLLLVFDTGEASLGF